jgi:hypothetical protein
VLLVAAAGVAVFIMQRNQLGGTASGGYEFVADVDNWQRTDRERAVTSPYDFNLAADLGQIPLELGDWKGEDVPQTNLEVFILLEPEQYVQRRYKREDGRYVWLSIVGSRKSKSFHSPQICYDADGWKTDAGSEPIPLNQGEMYALRLVANKQIGSGSSNHVVSYFYLWPSYERNPQDGLVVVKVTAPIYDTVENTLAIQKEFWQHLFTSARL